MATYRIARLVFAGSILAAAFAPAQTLTIQASADSFIRSGSPNQNQGDDGLLRVQSSGHNRALIRFDAGAVTNALGEGTLARARLELFVASNGDNWGSNGRTVDAHRLLVDWSEGGATWNCGIDQIPSNSKPDCPTQWAGGLFAEEPTDSVLHTNGMSGWIAFDVTADVAAFANGESDFGWLVKKTEEGQNGQIEYAARESGGDTAPRLVLVVESPTFDEVPPKIVIVAPAHDVVVGDTTPQILVAYQDGGSGIEPASFELFVDSQSIGGGCTVGAGQAVCESPPLAAGAHAVLARVRDAAGNVAEAMRSFELLTGPGLHQAVFDAVADTYLRQGSANQNQGSESILRVRQSGKNRALVRFDAAEIASTLAGATLRTAHLELAIAKNGNNWGSSGRTIDAHRLTRAWSEPGATWNCPDDSNPANQQADCSPLWNGGSMDPLPTATVLHSNGLGGTVRFDVTPDLAEVLAGAEPLGWLLKKTQEGQSGLVEYRSREDAAGPAPRLVVVFETTSTEPELPPDPATVAPPLTPESAVDLFAGSSFLWTGEDPVQFDVAPGGIVPDRIALVRGRVLRGDGTPHSGVRVSVHREAEVGWTLSREDGLFDLAVNGGGSVTLRYEKDDYLGAYRSLDVPAREWVDVDDVVLIQLDPVVTQITPGLTEMQVARGSVVTDEDGSRQATLLFPGGLSATMTLPDGSQQPLPTMRVRATEYSVGPLGPQQMPAELPENTGYTYAVELSADEAMAAGARRVEFSESPILYLENFLGFPVGEPVPVGYFDRERAVWVPERNGKVVEVLSVDGGVAELDLDGTGLPADAEALSALGITHAERVRVAVLYPAGARLWRVAIPHFTPWDCNWPYGPPPDAELPPAIEPEVQPPTEEIEEQTEEDEETDADDDCENNERGSVLDCGNQTLRDAVSLRGTPFSLAFSSERVRGTPALSSFSVRLTGDSIPASLQSVGLRVSAFGQTVDQRFQAAPNVVANVAWDQSDRFGRVVPLDAPVTIELTHYYPIFYYPARSDFENSFSRVTSGRVGLIQFVGGRFITYVGLKRTLYTTARKLGRPSLGSWDASTAGLGGWTLDRHHRFNPLTNVLHRGDGSRRLVGAHDTLAATFAGSGLVGDSGDGGPANQARLSWPMDIAFLPDGGVLIADVDAGRIRMVDRGGVISTFAGDGSSCESFGCGDGGPATQASISPMSVAIGPNGSVLIGDRNGCIRSVDRGGVISTLVGDCYQGPSPIGWPADLVVGSGGGIYIADSAWNQVRYLGTDGLVSSLAGDGSCDSTVGGVPALEAAICSPGGIAFDTIGQVLIAGGYSDRVLRVRLDGILEIVAGNGSFSGSLGDGGQATAARLSAPMGIATRADGSIFVADTFNGRVRRISPHGVIQSEVGGANAIDVDGISPRRMQLGWAEKVAIAPDGRIFAADSFDPRVLVVDDPRPLLRGDEYWIPSADGSEVYVFDRAGRHLRTVHALTGAALLRFDYDATGLLVAIVDFDGNTTRIERDGAGTPLGVAGPFGQRTTLEMDGFGYLAGVVDPAGGRHRFSYESGLLSLVEKPLGQKKHYSYSPFGKLIEGSFADAGHKRLFGSKGNPGEKRVSLTTSEGRQTSYEKRLDPDREVRWKRDWIRVGDVVVTRRVRSADGSTVRTRPDGTLVSTAELPDPIWGALVRFDGLSDVRTPGALGPTVAASQVATLSDSSNPLSVASRTHDVRVNNRLYRSYFDRESLTWTFTTPAGRTSTLEIDEVGRPVRSQVGDLEPVSYSYDGRGRLASIVQGGGFEQRAVDFAYDGLGRLLRVTDPLLRQVTFAYDAADRVIQQDLPGSRTVLFDWDANGNLISLTPPGKPAHLFDYSPVDLPAIYEPPDVGIGTVATDYAWNLDKNPDTITRPDGAQIVFGYDLGQRPVSITSPRGTQTIQWEPNRGRIQSVTTPEGVSLSYLYDGPLVTRTTWSGGGISGRVDRSYDDDLRLRSISVNGANAVTYAYDADSLLRQAGSLVLTRDPETGLLAGTTLGNVTTSYTYNGFGELASMTATFGAAPLYSETYTRDALGRIVTRVETIQGATTTYEYGYDAAGRLETVTKNGLLASQYTYDANGNRLAKQTPTVFETGSYDAQDRMLTYAGASYTYTAKGETLTKTDATGTTTYQYDVFGNLLGVDLPNGTQIRYKVDGRNRRIERSVNGVVTQRWLWQGQLSPIAELNASNAVVSRFVYATRVNVPDYMVKGGATYRILHDHLGSPRLVVNTSTGAIAQRMDFDEWGIVITDTNPGWQPFGFSGGVLDSEVGTTRLGSRDQVSELGRWLVRDPIDFTSGSPNLFTYVANDPINLSDIDGLAVGHHYVPRQVFENVPELSEQALDVFDNATTGGPIPGGHYYNRAHRDYTKAVQEMWDEWLSGNGLSPDRIDSCQANEFLQKVKESTDPRIRGFLDDIARRLSLLTPLGSTSARKGLKRLARKAGPAAAIGFFAYDTYSGGLAHAANEALWPISEVWNDD